ncbi:hypothetical protein H8958_014105, partial [Nasalis larvatus]
MDNASFSEPWPANASCLGRALSCSNASTLAPLPAPLTVAVPVVYAVICAVGLGGQLRRAVRVAAGAPHEDRHQPVHPQPGHSRRALHAGAAHQHRRLPAAAVALWGAHVQTHRGYRPVQHLLQPLLPHRHERRPLPGGVGHCRVAPGGRPHLQRRSRGEPGRVGARHTRRAALRSLRPARRRTGQAPVRAGLPAARGLLVAREPPLLARAGLRHSGVHHLCPLYHAAVPAACYAAGQPRQGPAARQEAGDVPGGGDPGRVPPLLDALPPEHRGGAHHRPPADAARHRYLLLHHQPELRQQLPQPLPLRLPGRQLPQEPPPADNLPRGRL